MEANLRWIAVTAIAPVAWGSTYFVTRNFLPADYPLYGAVLRALPAGLLLLLVVRTRPRGAWWWKSAVLGALNVGAFFVLVYVAAQLLPSSIASTLMALSAAMMMLCAWPLLGEAPRVLASIGAATGFAGVCCVLLTGTGAAGANLPGANLAGALASLAAMALSSVGYVLTKRWNSGVSVLALTSWQLIAGGLVVLPFAVLFEGGLPVLDPPALVGFGYVTVVATAIAFAAWFAGLRHLSAATVGLIGLLNPLTGVALGMVVAGENLAGLQVVGMVLVLVAIVLGLPQRRPRLTLQREGHGH
ncbi:putative blue pigment (indigoidine) exporter [Glaciihabitans tibetensis]|uniref:Putative blue pigment (Indigoidine) exporter n=1 Tax=Glaciihabitans tibetensis TaxID=1266600 RepID=A0A2T0VK64_9MICO|nr:EamA family transporter [Glaciihabitans tibetensis]PRY70579.1 putative blue pigment (indigoidine) exporter [Glaciihabitans tibetensis]